MVVVGVDRQMMTVVGDVGVPVTFDASDEVEGGIDGVPSLVFVPVTAANQYPVHSTQARKPDETTTRKIPVPICWDHVSGPVANLTPDRGTVNGR